MNEKPVYYDGSGKNLSSLNKTFTKETVVKPDNVKNTLKFPCFPYQK
ncbi:hypothetical protein [Bacillus sp. SG-1]|nr:hypothetical protein [Bacillus sp. SG-1]